jgi:hypothetical protein
MDNPTFEEDTETLKSDHQEPEGKGQEIEKVKTDGTNTIHGVFEQSPDDPGGGENKKLTMKGSPSNLMDLRTKATEEPADEPDGGKKKDLPVKDSPQKKRISFNLLGSSGASDDSIEENFTPKQLERYKEKGAKMVITNLFREEPGEDPALRNKIKSVKWGNGSEVNLETQNSTYDIYFVFRMIPQLGTNQRYII